MINVKKNTMKIKSITPLLYLFIAMSCSDENEIFTSESESLPPIQIAYEQSKELTFIHNEMLDEFYKQALLDKLKFSKPLPDEDVEQFVNQFVYSIDKQSIITRSLEQNRAIDANQVIKITQMNDAFRFSKALHTRNTELADVMYLDMFCDEFYNIESKEISIENVDLVIKSILDNVMMKYPDLSNEQMEKLAFVSSLTYNSYNYWYENAADWYINLKADEGRQTRGVWKDLWGAVKSGTKKWAYADSKGAVAAMSGAGLLGNAVAPATALAGAAVGSTIGAIENFFN